ncbi:MAG: chemotaxis protein CheW [Pseudomonadota bacterium]
MNAVAHGFEPGTQWVLFALDSGRYALPLPSIERIVRAAEYTPLPLAPAAVLGAIDVAGNILPVFNLRNRFQLPERPLALTDQFIIARTARRRVVLAIDAALGVLDEPALGGIDSARLAPGMPHLRGVLSLPDGLVLIQDLERFLNPDETTALDTAISDEEKRRAR